MGGVGPPLVGAKTCDRATNSGVKFVFLGLKLIKMLQKNSKICIVAIVRFLGGIREPPPPIFIYFFFDSSSWLTF